MIASAYRVHLLLAVLLPAFLPAILPAQDTTPLPRALLMLKPDTLVVAQPWPGDSLQLPHTYVLPSSEKLLLRSFRLLGNIHYRTDYRNGRIHLLQSLASNDSLTIIYRHYPFPLPQRLSNRELQLVHSDSSSSDSNSIAMEARSRIMQEIDSYQSNLSKSGSIVRGIEIGSNRDLTLNSGLNLQLSGKITPNVELLAALTDESTPIQPEGNTQTLREVDKVFVRINSPYAGGTLGDFNLQYQNSIFGNVQRKLQGVTIDNNLKGSRQQFTFGTSRGLFTSYRFLAQEGNQGPYQLRGSNGEDDIIVLAGTEKIFVDGVPQTRGENNDYVIDYGLGQITFTNKRLITSENRIEADFEYTNAFQRYGRNFTGFSSAWKQPGRRIGYDVRMFREWDDTQNLLEDDAALSPEETGALERAGDDPFGAVVSGVDSVGADRGSYSAVQDTLNNRVIYVFQGRGNGEFSITFANVGVGKGDYRRGPSLGEFIYVAPGAGSFLPVRLVPLAGDRRFANAGIDLAILPGWSLRGEFALSQNDRNIFSSLDDNDNNGGALQLTSTLRDTALQLGGAHLGNLQLSTRWTRQDSGFASLDRPLQPEYAYKWNLNNTVTGNEENSLEASANYLPRPFLRLQAGVGFLEKAKRISSQRRSGQLELLSTRLPKLLYSYETIDSETGADETDWVRQRLQATRSFRRFTPRYEYQQENRTLQSGSSLNGFLFRQHLSGVDARDLLGINWRASAQLRRDYLYNPRRAGELLDLAATATYEIGGEFNDSGALKGRFSFALRDKNYDTFFEGLPADSLEIYRVDAQFQDTSWADRQSHLANIELQYRNKEGTINSRLDYQVASELQSRREQIYFFIGNNQGNFRFDSTLAEYVPDPLGDFILILRQTGEFESIIRLESGWQVIYRPTTPSPLTRGWRRGLKLLSGQSYLKLEEQSRENNIWNIYLLKLDSFHNIRSSLSGSYQINQDLYYHERNPDWGLLVRSRYRDNLSNQFLQASDNETRINWERLLQIRKRFFRRRLNLTGEYQNTLNKRFVTSTPSRNRNILSQAFIARINYRPSLSWQLQLDSERGIERDRNPASQLRINYWDLRPELAWSIHGKARATANTTFIRVQEVDNPFELAIPFELGKGKKIGDSWQWNLRFEYFISTNVTINANYTGRSDAAAARTIHLGKAEVRAFF